jgi:glycerol-3-phosphate acyltransferase PlsY
MMENVRLISDSWELFLLWWLISYTIGSFLWGPIIVLWIKRQRKEKVDLFYLFHQGSCSPGATNVGRIVGTKGKIYTILLDATKGAVAVAVSLVFHFPLWAVALSGFLSMIGHAFPFIYLQFGYRGGKAVATALGVFLVLSPKIAFPTLLFYLLFALSGKIFKAKLWVRIAKTSSIRSLSTCMVIVLLSVIIDKRPEVMMLAIISTVFIAWLHQSNIARLMAGTELEG